jgi:mono/diheme cytochrome c family protein
MKSRENIKALRMALITTSLAMASALGAAAELRREARRTSHQQPAEETWLETPTPTSPALVGRGRELFLDSCAHCHAADARGDEGPDLHGVQVSDRYIATIITHGIKGEMPSFAKKLHAAEITALTAYVRSLE